MRVEEAIAARRSVRAFLDRPVEVDVVRRVLERAARAPSGGNLQPWHIDIVHGDALARLKTEMRIKLASGEVEQAAYAVYPPALGGAYKARSKQVGEDMYAHLGIPREDRSARRAWFANNFAFFGAPLALFCTVNRQMGPPQWSDLGMFLQTVMLLLVAEGLASCPQECWAMYPETVGRVIGTPDERMLFCGMAIGWEDSAAPVNRLRSTRAPAAEWLGEVR